MERISSLERNTKETQIKLTLNLDGEGKTNIDTGVGFFDHMLNLMAFHGGFDLDIKAHGDLEVCDHHLVEDTGILLGKAFFITLSTTNYNKKRGSAASFFAVEPLFYSHSTPPYHKVVYTNASTA